MFVPQRPCDPPPESSMRSGLKCERLATITKRDDKAPDTADWHALRVRE